MLKYTVKFKLNGGKWNKYKYPTLWLALRCIESLTKASKGQDYKVTLTKGVF